jgi:hypothetical protein
MMGRWLPGFRPGTPEQARAWRASLIDLWRNPDRAETPRYLALNDRADDLCQPLGRAQQAWHFQVALTEYDRQQTRQRRARRPRRRSR